MSQQINQSIPPVTPVPEPTAGEQILQSLSNAGEFIVETAVSAKDAIVNKVNEATEFIQANVAEAAYDFHAAEASDPNEAPGHRLVARARMEADALDMAVHKEGQDFHHNMADNRSKLASVEIQQGMNNLGDAASKTGQAISQTASEMTNSAGESLANASQYISETATNATQYISETAANAKDAANQQVRVASKNFKEGVDNIEEQISQTATSAKNEANIQAKIISKDLKEGVDDAEDTAISYKDALVNKVDEVTTPNDPITNKFNEASEALKERKADVDYSIHKAELKNSDANLSDRIVAGVSMTGDAIEGAAHAGAKEYYKKI